MADLSRIMHPVALAKDEAFATLLGPEGYTDGAYRLEKYSKPNVGSQNHQDDPFDAPAQSPLLLACAAAPPLIHGMLLCGPGLAERRRTC